jgi:hypothetical protein
MKLGSQHILPLVILAAAVLGCNQLSERANTNSATNSTTATKATPSTVEPNEDGTVPSGTGVEKEKPEAGKANVQGKAFFNDKPAAGVEVKLCTKFNQYGTGCGGKTYTAKTDDAGEYLIKGVEPGLYEALTVRVFNTPYYVFATSGILSAAKYDIPADKTFFAPDSNLFKNDVKLTAPKAGSKVAAENIEVKWDVYPDAAYYKMSIHADSTTTAKTDLDFVGKRVDDPTFVLTKPLPPGDYTVRIDAFNANDRKLAQTSNDFKFTVK